MKSMTRRFGLLGVCFAFALLALLPAAQLRASAKDQLVVTGLTDSNGFSPTVTGAPPEYHYATTIPAGLAVADTIPVQFDLSNNNGAGETFTVTMSPAGEITKFGSISFDTSSFTITAPASGVLHYVYISTLALAPGDYHENIQISAEPHSDVSISHATLHLLIHVVPNDGTPTCNITDSTGLLLTDCAGNPVATGGEFLIVTNFKKITATNPGQFYYNFVWTNTTGGDVTFTSLSLTSSTNVTPQGTNSVHVLIYNASGFTASFDDVNTSGIPCGKTGTTCKSPITVPNGQTLWLTWHVAYNLIGGPVPGDLLPFGLCPTTPASDAIISMSATLSTDGGFSQSCGPVTANGYKVN